MTTPDLSDPDVTKPDACQLCEMLGYEYNEIGVPEGMVTQALGDGSTKIVHCCQRCCEEAFDDQEFIPYNDCVFNTDRTCPVCQDTFDATATEDGVATFTHETESGVEVCQLPVPRERCPVCLELLQHESTDPLEEFCIAAPCDYYRAEGSDNVTRVQRISR